MTNKQKLQLKFRVGTSYLGFLFETFFKRPMGYVISLVYMLFLALILIIVPKLTRSGPLSIWNLGGFNMPIFNLFFIAAMAASIAVVIFKIGVEDGTELTLSAKPLTKNMRVGIKTLTYLLIMLLISGIILAMVSLVMPIFGEYDLLENIRGITAQEYKSLLLSIFIGNIVNTLFFGGIAVLLSLVGTQVITMIGTVGIAFILCLLNVLYPLIAGTPVTVLLDTYGTSINSISANTLAQMDGSDDSDALNLYKPFAAIQCVTQEDGTETQHFDTYEYWTKANREAGTIVTNYFDFAKQLSSLFSGFGLDERRLEEASKVSIGTNPSFKYSIDKNTGLNAKDNISNKNYPVAIYSLYSKQGVSYPVVRLLGGNTGLSIDNWYAFSKVNKADFNSLTCVSLSPKAILSEPYFRDEVGKSYYCLTELHLGLDKDGIAAKQAAAEVLFNKYMDLLPDDEPWDSNNYSRGYEVVTSAASIISEDTSGQFFTGNWSDLKVYEKTSAMSLVLIHWMIAAQKWQNNLINIYKNKSTDPIIKNDKFPYSSKTVKSWIVDEVDLTSAKTPNIKLYNQEQLIEKMFSRGIYVDQYQFSTHSDPTPFYVYPVNSELEFCETYKNMYQYRVSSYFNVYVLTAIWTSISIALFAVSIVVYKKTDFK